MFSLSQGLCGPDKNRLALISTEGLVKSHSILCMVSLNGKHTKIYLFSAWETPKLKGDKELGITAFVFTVT